ncbi:galactosylgalactosylxylosylprotein 3-beta-glucuronosyltransferase 1 isoform X1 [Hemibagrus wyckioides]|uniref:galactosylgalactosylxylosylprotein 3-beta-glucuronosyltransferase 1 isoform X1 n=1 Tax=Hemibagrus wyckioides TaxID=337641 RepID=UPI00266BA312|nr:galactosylgalactosylxylosylprotein 3-beta-glucuronosyltransferase 1 isoform X1 [Hemibagrus wyckioides]XP_058267387.1 galactosylgalactosylxylosylprotein 3-beta-glucuronosyltransferase 1 isoform X1 [Hemibagrus wyckioides]XP_058267389.1 galactosylgalactosylxylosylprotein 3-beta-glucuronosyltransferase 1 isoform X1 [Hemibagrus wyckioides]XP_058267390.1 galactosylgalactosylxylosylprotein 3-beta-glucuronosyltransferase 1 isoform X1 [Hemibagrus wyckioides]XP_058267391.1 galactosylgalactosylxylosylp
MPRRRDILAFVLIVLPWTLLINMWHQSPVTPHHVTLKNVTKVQKIHLRENCITNNGVLRDHAFRRAAPWSEMLPTIHVITPTYTRAVQKAELTRLTNTFLHVPNLHWIVVEDSPRRTPLVSRLLRSSGLNHTHLNVETPRVHRMRKEARGSRVPRGTAQRNLGLRWLRENLGRTSRHQGVVYFADDDNTYSLELFEEMRSTKKVSVWPVAFVGGLRYESPKINTLGKVYGWSTVFDPRRPFAIDMAGFAVNLRLILSKPQAYFKLNGVKGGYQESSLLGDLVTLNELEPKAENCTKVSRIVSVLVWHTRTERPVLVNEGKKGFTDFNVEI